jgi:hypothetical protein
MDNFIFRYDYDILLRNYLHESALFQIAHNCTCFEVAVYRENSLMDLPCLSTYVCSILCLKTLKKNFRVTYFWAAPGSGKWNLWWTKWRRGRFSPRTSVSPAKTIHSTNFSILTITRGRHAEALRRADLPSKESCRLS